MLKSKAPFVLAVATAFFVYQFYLLANSFQAEYGIYVNATAGISKGSMWSLFWLISELTGEVGLIVRFAGACFFVAFAWVLLRKKQFALSILRKGILFEGLYYLFNIPFNIYLLVRPASSVARQAIYYETAISYIIQIVLVSSSFLLLYIKIKNPNVEKPELLKWCAIAFTSYAFALWIKHFMFNLYALPINFADPVLLVGFLNSALTILAASLILLVAFMPIIRGKGLSFNSKAVGAALILIGTYFVIYILVATVNAGYMSFLGLTELWAIAMPILGAGFLFKK